MKEINVPSEVLNADCIFVSHSGGKDSQAMLSSLIKLGFYDKLVLVHSDLEEMEWEPMHHWIEKISFGLPVHIVRAEMDFFELCRETGRLPSGKQQYCTDFLKTKPITKFIHDYMTKKGFKTAINATGMRAEESKRRAGKKAFGLSKGQGSSGMHQPRNFPTHTIFDWMPIFDFSTIEVFGEIAQAGQEPHKVYSMGFSRLSCVFCINGKIGEHKQAAKLRPELAQKMSDLERELGKSLRLKQSKGVKSRRYLDEYVFCN